MNRVIAVEPRPGYKLWLQFSDRVEGLVDLSELAGRGVFKAWCEPGVFESVRLGPAGSVAWDDEIEICPDRLYLDLTGRRPEEMFPPLVPLDLSA